MQPLSGIHDADQIWSGPIGFRLDQDAERRGGKLIQYRHITGVRSKLELLLLPTGCEE
ncbi:MAG: hypothetical protein PVI78_08975 [Anaerolineales bacterium]